MNISQITRRYKFCSAHFLPMVPEGHKCKRLHGHNYELEVVVRGPKDNQMGWILDFWQLDAIMKPLIDQVDHYCLNDVMSNPTAENIAWWFVERIDLGNPLLRVFTVNVFEEDSAVASAILHTNSDQKWTQ